MSRYDRTLALIEREVAALNEALGYSTEFDKDFRRHCVTFGYIGNGRMTASGWDLSGVRYYVFLPHPGRVGRDEDRIGGFDHGDLEGAGRTLGQLGAALKVARLAGGAR